MGDLGIGNFSYILYPSEYGNDSRLINRESFPDKNFVISEDMEYIMQLQKLNVT